MTNNRKLWIITVLALLVVLNGCAYYNYLYNANINYKKGMDSKTAPNAAQGAGKTDFDKVVDGCATMLDFFPDSRWVPEALDLMGKAYFETEQYSKAERKFLELEKNYPTSKYIPEAKLYKARCWLAQKQTKEGRDLLIELQSEPDRDVQYSARLLLADALVADSSFAQALEQYNSMVGKAPTKDLEIATEQKRLACLLKLDRRDSAITTIDKLLKYKFLRPKQHEYRVLRAQLWVKLGQTDKAIADLTKLMHEGNFRDRRDSTQVELGAAYYAKGDTAKALKYWNELLENDHNHNDITSEAAYYRGMFRLKNGAVDSLILQDWTRASHDRPGAKYAVLADTAAAHFHWTKSITDRYAAARSQYDVLLDLLSGADVPDSIRNRYIAVVRPTRGARDTTNAIKSGTTQPKPDEQLKPGQIDTTHSEALPVSKTPDIKPEIVPNQSEQMVSQKPVEEKEAALKALAPSDSSKAVSSKDTVVTRESVAPVAVADTTKMAASDTIAKTPVVNDSMANAIADTMGLKAVANIDSTQATKQVALDTLSILNALGDAEKTLVHVIEEKKDEALYRKDTTSALKFYPEILEVASGRTLTAYEWEYAVLLSATGDSIHTDSLYRIVAQDSLQVPIANAARKELQMTLLPVPIDSLHTLLRDAEWVLDAFQDTTTALDIYRSITKADSGVHGEKATAALAILSVRRVKADSLEALFDKMSKVARNPAAVSFARHMVSNIQESRRLDSLAALPDTSHRDSLKVAGDTLSNKKDTLAGKNDTLKIHHDSTSVVPDTTMARKTATSAKVDSNKTVSDSSKMIPIDTTAKKAIHLEAPKSDTNHVQGNPAPDTTAKSPIPPPAPPIKDK